MFTVHFTDNDKAPTNKLADAELQFTAGPLAGLRLIGFAVWENRAKGYNVTFPARQYTVNGERRSFALLRPAANDAGPAAQDRIRDLIVDAYREHVAIKTMAAHQDAEPARARNQREDAEPKIATVCDTF